MSRGQRSQFFSAALEWVNDLLKNQIGFRQPKEARKIPRFLPLLASTVHYKRPRSVSLEEADWRTISSFSQCQCIIFHLSIATSACSNAEFLTFSVPYKAPNSSNSLTCGELKHLAKAINNLILPDSVVHSCTVKYATTIATQAGSVPSDSSVRSGSSSQPTWSIAAKEM